MTPQALAVGPAGDLYIGDTGNNHILMLPWDSKTGAFGTAEILGTNFFPPDGIAIGAHSRRLRLSEVGIPM